LLFRQIRIRGYLINASSHRPTHLRG